MQSEQPEQLLLMARCISFVRQHAYDSAKYFESGSRGAWLKWNGVGGQGQDGKVQNIENQVHGSPALRECVCHIWGLGLAIHI